MYFFKKTLSYVVGKALLILFNMFIFFACPKKTNQKKRQPFTWFSFAELPCAAHKVRTLRKVAYAQPNRLSALCCAARLREMAFSKAFMC
jgi:hypothetical protein